MNEDYSKREIDTFMKEIQSSLLAMTNENISSHTKLNENQKITNGNVASIQRWRERVVGATWALSLVLTVIMIPLFTWAFIVISKIPKNIDDGIKEALSAYNIEIK